LAAGDPHDLADFMARWRPDAPVVRVEVIHFHKNACCCQSDIALDELDPGVLTCGRCENGFTRTQTTRPSEENRAACRSRAQIIARSSRASRADDRLGKAWLGVQTERLRLAQAHLAVAEKLNAEGTQGNSGPEKRSVISRAYYAMFCAARAALAYHESGDTNDHGKLPTGVRDVSTWKQPQRDRVVSALIKYRTFRNDADYSPFYPRQLGRDAVEALQEARAVVKISIDWLTTDAS
jgi:hypothetical protein